MNQLPVQFTRDMTPGNVKAAMKAAGAGSGDFWNVPRARLRIMPGFNVRVQTPAYLEHVRTMAEDMRRNGYDRTKPLAGIVLVEDGKLVIYVTDGHTRLLSRDMAVDELGAQIDTLPVRIVQVPIDPETKKPRYGLLRHLTIRLHKSNTGQPLQPVELGIACQRLEEDGMTEQEIAAEMAISRQYANGLLRLLKGPADLLQKVIAEEMSATTAIQILRKHGEAAPQIAQAAADEAKASGKQKATATHVRKAEADITARASTAEAAKAPEPAKAPRADANNSKAAANATPTTSAATKKGNEHQPTASDQIEITDAMRYEHLMRSVDATIVLGDEEYTCRKEIDAAIDARIRAAAAKSTRKANGGAR